MNITTVIPETFGPCDAHGPDYFVETLELADGTIIYDDVCCARCGVNVIEDDDEEEPNNRYLLALVLISTVALTAALLNFFR